MTGRSFASKFKVDQGLLAKVDDRSRAVKAYVTMAFVLALVGGAAAVEIGRLLNKDNNKPLSKELEALQSKEEELQQTLQAGLFLSMLELHTLQ